MDPPRVPRERYVSSHIKVRHRFALSPSLPHHICLFSNLISFFFPLSHVNTQTSTDRNNKNAWSERQEKSGRAGGGGGGGGASDRNAIPMGSNTSGGVKLLGTSGLTSADRHGGSVQVVSSTNGDLTTDDPATGHSNTPITGPVELDAVSETK